jgi:demethylmenaquinone methyltransferase/2-methoxy-6-polyprenyl-1,4-benzoquinol methylase
VKKDTKSLMRAEGSGYYTGDKAEYVRDMFSGIARRYDLLNSVLSFNRHRAWRRCAVKLAGLRQGDSALDVCSGTGDFAIALAAAVGSEGFVAGSDFCRPMLAAGRSKTETARGAPVSLLVADTLALPHGSGKFDCVTVGFGIRNVANVERAFEEMTRVTRVGGRVICLEFNRPRNPIWGPIVMFYEGRILPVIGGLLSRSVAYTYLQKSIKAFHSREELTEIMERMGLRDIRVIDLNFGSVCIHIGTKA